MPKMIVTVESYRFGVFARKSAKEGQSPEGQYARVRGRSTEGRLVSSVAWDEAALRMDKQLSGLTPQGISVEDMRFTMELTGEERLDNRRDGKGKERVLHVESFNILTGPAVELHRSRIEAAAVHQRAAALVSGDDYKAAFEALQEFVGTFGRVAASQEVDFDEATAETVRREAETSVAATTDMSKPGPMEVVEAVSTASSAEVVGGSSIVPSADVPEIEADAASSPVPEVSEIVAAVPEAATTSEVENVPEPAAAVTTVAEPEGGVAVRSGEGSRTEQTDVSEPVPVEKHAVVEEKVPVRQVVEPVPTVVPGPVSTVSPSASAPQGVPVRRRGSSMAPRELVSEDERVELPEACPEVAAARDFAAAAGPESRVADAPAADVAPVEQVPQGRRSTMGGGDAPPPRAVAAPRPDPRPLGAVNAPAFRPPQRPGAGRLAPPGQHVRSAAPVQAAAPAPGSRPAASTMSPAPVARPAAPVGRSSGFGGSGFGSRR